MKIASSLVQMASERQYTQQTTRQESLKAWIGNRPPNVEGDSVSLSGQSTPPSAALASAAPPSTALASTALASTALASTALASTALASTATGHVAAEDLEMDDSLTPELRMLRLLLKKVFGVKVRLDKGRHEGYCNGSKKTGQDARSPAAAPARQGWGIEYDLHESYYEAEQTTFSASGIVKTADGQSVRFDLNLAMSREYAAERHVSFRAGDAVDPLIVHFDGTAAQLSSTRFGFDLDADGEVEQIASTAAGSGFLALDIDGNGVITDGSELFGPTTGDGFAELAGYDADGNQWIDENDAIYDELRVWQDQTSEAGGSLSTLRALDIGAIYLGRQSTPFAVKDAANQTLGQVVASSVFLGEDGGAGSVQQINLTV